MAAYSGVSRPVRTAMAETMQQSPTAAQVGMASLMMRRSW